MSARCTQQVLRDIVGTDASDADLLGRFRDYRDESAFVELVRRYKRTVWRAAARVLSDPADINDAFQTAFLVLIRRADRLEARTGIGPWLYGVAHRVAL